MAQRQQQVCNNHVFHNYSQKQGGQITLFDR